MARLKVTLVRSPIGLESSQRRTCVALGLKKMQSSRVHEDNPVIRGMVHKVRHLVKVESDDRDSHDATSHEEGSSASA